MIVCFRDFEITDVLLLARTGWIFYVFAFLVTVKLEELRLLVSECTEFADVGLLPGFLPVTPDLTEPPLSDEKLPIWLS